MTVSSKIRIYDLAKELKLDTKRLIEEVRREGVDVSVPSNSVSKELAEKIRNKYFPKKETTLKRGVRVVKRAERAVEEHPPVEAVEAIPEPEAETVAPPSAPQAEAPVSPAPVGVPKQPTTARLIKKLAPATRAEQPTLDAAPAVAAAEATVEIEEAPDSPAPAGLPEAQVPASVAPAT